ncbi:hypothetical protein BDA99DRAFT_515106 [Phascolomyces articulosus]|uniref:Uncharacterized protein n=1 Tax=Phascolomyces articulosus TaxID=60185 RepID=A0AAD5JWK1_9FUNG|nr:hypothetical protein BDA99DRAFT_515106 [Phascolomyces articulosus]
MSTAKYQYNQQQDVAADDSNSMLSFEVLTIHETISLSDSGSERLSPSQSLFQESAINETSINKKALGSRSFQDLARIAEEERHQREHARRAAQYLSMLGRRNKWNTNQTFDIFKIRCKKMEQLSGGGIISTFRNEVEWHLETVKLEDTSRHICEFHDRTKNTPVDPEKSSSEVINARLEEEC